MEETTNELERRALLLLREYDKLHSELKNIQLQLSRACTDYGVATRRWGYTADMLRRDNMQRQDKREAS